MVDYLHTISSMQLFTEILGLGTGVWSAFTKRQR